ncbi:MAG: hypothetical protein J6Z34_03635 [Clostridia bacterium]|nr:hypothetical protein [Clostridia bacterium]
MACFYGNDFCTKRCESDRIVHFPADTPCPRGPQGPMGLQGPIGPQGPQGEPGPEGTVNITAAALYAVTATGRTPAFAAATFFPAAQTDMTFDAATGEITALTAGTYLVNYGANYTAKRSASVPTASLKQNGSFQAQSISFGVAGNATGNLSKTVIIPLSAGATLSLDLSEKTGIVYNTVTMNVIKLQ